MRLDPVGSWIQIQCQYQRQIVVRILPVLSEEESHEESHISREDSIKGK